MDDDNLVEPAVLENLSRDFVDFPDAGLIAPMAIRVGGPKDCKIWPLGSDFNRWTSQPADHLADISIAELPQNKIRFPTRYSQNAFMVRKSTFENVGGFDVNLPFNYDDADFG